MTGAFDRDQIQRCNAELGIKLPELCSKHKPLVVIAALTEHIGGSLLLTQNEALCTPEAARAIIERVREIAFAP
ncbi:MAG TPA: hypothetical protein VI653_26650 [Steroidobacteraceae bacterium]